MKKIVVLIMSMILCIATTNAFAFSLGEEKTRTITLPMSFFEDRTFEEIQSSMGENKEIKTCTQDEDGNVVYTITEKGLEEMFASFKETTDKTILGMTEGEEEIESFVSIVYNDAFTQFDVYVDSEKYSPWDSFAATFTFYFYGNLYQTMSGIPEEEQDVVVNFIDNVTLEVISSVCSKK